MANLFEPRFEDSRAAHQVVNRGDEVSLWEGGDPPPP
jgi:hypothetical protein